MLYPLRPAEFNTPENIQEYMRVSLLVEVYLATVRCKTIVVEELPVYSDGRSMKEAVPWALRQEYIVNFKTKEGTKLGMTIRGKGLVERKLKGLTHALNKIGV